MRKRTPISTPFDQLLASPVPRPSVPQRCEMKDPVLKAKKGRVKAQIKAVAANKAAHNHFELAPAVRRHHKVMGERDKRGLSVQQGRARSEQIRRESLAVEHSQQGRTNSFVDGRFGENDESMPLEDKLIRRFQRERQRQIRGSKFSLDDGEASMEELTHAGRSLGEMDALADVDFRASDDDDDNGGFGDADFVNSANFGGGGVSAGTGGASAADERRSKLEEAIARNKLNKLEKREQKSEDEKLLNQLDGDFNALRGLIFQASVVRS